MTSPLDGSAKHISPRLADQAQEAISCTYSLISRCTESLLGDSSCQAILAAASALQTSIKVRSLPSPSFLPVFMQVLCHCALCAIHQSFWACLVYPKANSTTCWAKHESSPCQIASAAHALTSSPAWELKHRLSMRREQCCLERPGLQQLSPSLRHCKYLMSTRL